MRLQVHRHQSLLQLLDMGCCIFDQPFMPAQTDPPGGKLRVRAETALQKAVGIQLAQPPGITDVGLPA